MRDTYNTHRASHPLAEFIATKAMDGAFYDDEAIVGDTFYGRVGKRIIIHDSQGFIDLVNFDSAEEALIAIDLVEEDEQSVW